MSRETRTPTPHPPLYFTRCNHRRCCTNSMMDVSHLFPMELPRVATESRPRVRAQMKPQKVLRIRLYYPRPLFCVRACGFDSRRRRLHLGEILNLKTLRTTSVSGSTSSYEREGGCTPRAGDVAPPRGCRRTIDLHHSNDRIDRHIRRRSWTASFVRRRTVSNALTPNAPLPWFKHHRKRAGGRVCSSE